MADQGNQISINGRYTYYEKDSIYQQANSEVFVGTDNQQRQQVTIKVTNQNIASPQPDDLVVSVGGKKEPREINGYRMMQDSICPFLLTIHDIIDDPKQNTTTVITEWCDQGSLKVYSDKVEFFNEMDALYLFKQVAIAVSEYHELNLAHGNINFNNILLTNSFIKLTDILKINRDELFPPQYLANAVLKRTMEFDIWTLGVILHQMLYGVFPFSGKKEEILNQIGRGERDFNSVNQQSMFPIVISTDIDSILKKMLDKNPANRPQIHDILNLEAINQIPLDANPEENGPYAELTQEMTEQYILYQPTRMFSEFDGYLHEDIYFGFSIEQQVPVHFKIIYTGPDEDIDRFFEKLVSFQQVGDPQLVEVYDSIIEDNQVFIISSYSNQGTIGEYFMKRAINTGKGPLDSEIDDVNKVSALIIRKIDNSMSGQYHGFIHLENLFINQGGLKIGEPLFITQQAEQQFMKSAEQRDVFAPEFKATITATPGSAYLERVDIWSFGAYLYRLIAGEGPYFEKGFVFFPQNLSFHPKHMDIITRCLDPDPRKRCDWNFILAQSNESIQPPAPPTPPPKQPQPQPPPPINRNPNQINAVPVMINSNPNNNMLGSRGPPPNGMNNVPPPINNNNGNPMMNNGPNGNPMNNGQPPPNMMASRAPGGIAPNNMMNNGMPPPNNGMGASRIPNMNGGPPMNNNSGGPPPMNNMNGGPPMNNMNGGPPMNNMNGGMNGGPPMNNMNGGPPMNNMNGPPFNNNNGQPPFNMNASRAPPQNNFNGGPPGNNMNGPPFNNNNNGQPPFNMNASRAPPPNNMEMGAPAPFQPKIQQNKPLQPPPPQPAPIPYPPASYTQPGPDESHYGLVEDENNSPTQNPDQQKITEDQIDEDIQPVFHLIPINTKGGQTMRKAKNVVKIIIVILMLMTIWFRQYFANAASFLVQRGYFDNVTVTVLNDQKQFQQISILTMDPDSYKSNQAALKSVVANNLCFQNIFDPQNHPDRELVNFIHSASFFWWDMFSMIVMIIIIIVKCMHVTQVDAPTIWKNRSQRALKPHNQFLVPLLIFTHFELAFMYHCHYQIFNFFYYAIRNPCLGVQTIDGTGMIFDTTQYLMNGEAGQFIQYAFFTFGFFFILHMIGALFFIVYPVRNAQIFTTPVHIVLRFISYFLGVFLICQIGVFLVIGPTYGQDDANIVQAVYNGGDFMGIIGFFPELFELIITCVDLLIQGIFYAIDRPIEDPKAALIPAQRQYAKQNFNEPNNSRFGGSEMSTPLRPVQGQNNSQVPSNGFSPTPTILPGQKRPNQLGPAPSYMRANDESFPNSALNSPMPQRNAPFGGPPQRNMPGGVMM